MSSQWITIRPGWKWQRGPWSVCRVGSTRGTRWFEVHRDGKLFDMRMTKTDSIACADEEIDREERGEAQPWTEAGRAEQREQEAQDALDRRLASHGSDAAVLDRIRQIVRAPLDDHYTADAGRIRQVRVLVKVPDNPNDM